MNTQKFNIKTNDGTTPCLFFSEGDSGKTPAVVLYMDAFGIRPALEQMAARLATKGFRVLLPDLYYRAGPQKPFDPATAFAGGPEKDRIMALYGSLNQALVMADTAAWLDFLANEPSVTGKVGTVGYCMGGAYALSAAGFFPDRVGAAASFHGARLATDKPDSPHLLAPKIKARMYFGIAANDNERQPDQKDKLKEAFAEANVPAEIEVYSSKHGWCISDMPFDSGKPIYNKADAERAWAKLVALYKTGLA